MNQYLFTNRQILTLHVIRAESQPIAKSILDEYYSYQTKGWTNDQIWENIGVGQLHIVYFIDATNF